MKYLSVIVLFALIAAGSAIAADQVRPPNASTNEDLVNLWNQIQSLKKSDGDISAELYQQYFDLEQQLYPERFSNGRGRTLDQGADACPGFAIVQPDQGLFDYTDYGQTYTYNNDCTFPQCRNGRDVIYMLQISHHDSLLITTCGSGFDTYLCIYAGACCQPGSSPVYFNDDSPICGLNSMRSAIHECFQPGLYYIVVDGFNATAQGHYQLNIQSQTGGNCGQNPQISCPPDYQQHNEGPDEGVCEYGTTVTCPAHYCGAIGGLGDLDVYKFTLSECEVVTISAWGNDTPGHYGTGHGLNPVLNLYTSSCESPIYSNDDVQGNPPDMTGHDSRIVTLCLRAPETYWVELGGDQTAGLYEFTIECQPCVPALAISGIVYGAPGPNCFSWPVQVGATTYYVWKSVNNGPWNQVSTTNTTSYCDPDGNQPNPQYRVFDNPCGQP